MARATQKTGVFGGLALAALLAFAPVAQAAQTAQSCTQPVGQAVAAGADLKLASTLLSKAASCDLTNLDAAAIQKLIADIKSLVGSSTLAMSKGGNKDAAGKIISIALAYAGQPSVVAVDPTLYSTVLADAANYVELASDEGGDGGLGEQVNLARKAGALPSNNQQPTVSIEQK